MQMLQASLHLVLVCGVAGSKGHAFLNPGYDAHSGKNFSTTLLLPEEADDDGWTSRVVIAIPQGIRSVTPASKTGWTVSVNKGTITFTADEKNNRAEGLGLTFTLYMTIGCRFENASDDMLWQGQYSLWWRTTQYFSPVGSARIDESRSVHWTVLPESPTSLWSKVTPSDGFGPCPYIFIKPDVACAAYVEDVNTSANARQSDRGMWWLGSIISPSIEAPSDRDPAEIVSSMVQSELDKQGFLENRLAAFSQAKSKSASNKASNMRSRHSVSNRGRVGRHHRNDVVMDEDGDLTDDTKTNLVNHRYFHFLPHVSDAHKRTVAKVVVVALFVIPIVVFLAVGVYRCVSCTVTRSSLKKFKGVLLRNREDSDSIRDPAHSNPELVPCSSSQRIESDSLQDEGRAVSIGHPEALPDAMGPKSDAMSPAMVPLVVGAPC